MQVRMQPGVQMMHARPVVMQRQGVVNVHGQRMMAMPMRMGAQPMRMMAAPPGAIRMGGAMPMGVGPGVMRIGGSMNVGGMQMRFGQARVARPMAMGPARVMPMHGGIARPMAQPA